MISKDPSKTVICVVGPTASGKSALAQLIAESIGGEIVNADSMQIYRGMDIGTAKVTPEHRTVAYHCIDIVDPGEPFSASLFQSYARDAIEDILHRGKVPILVGGTGFYVRAAVDDYDFPKGEQLNDPVRIKWQKFLEKNGAQALWDELNHLDAESAAIIHPNNTKRVIRALELNEQGIRYADQVESLKKIPEFYPSVQIGLKCDRDVLYSRIEDRVDQMRKDGLEEEVKGLIEQGFVDAVTANQAIGYKEIASAISGDISMDEAYDQIKKATRRYAKRQISWFGQDDRISWIDCTDGNIASALISAMDILADKMNLNEDV